MAYTKNFILFSFDENFCSVILFIPAMIYIYLLHLFTFTTQCIYHNSGDSIRQFTFMGLHP